MNTLKEKLDLIFPFDIYGEMINNISKYEIDDQGWVNVSIETLEEHITSLKPELIIEVGAWKGLSTIIMASLCARNKLDTKIITIDTWLGAQEHWDLLDKYRDCGYPIGLYKQFLANVIANDFDEIIYPMPQTSLNAATILKKFGITSKLVYIDGSHDRLDVYNDLNAYWPLVEQGGILFGDDYGGHWTGVKEAVDQFAEEHKEEYKILKIEGFSFHFYKN